jgi:DNA-binding GntR family transcriptional regulator
MSEATEYNPALPRIQSLHLKDEAYRLIKDAITTLQFRPGDPVIEGDLARRLGISKTPVRNALVRLEQEGLVQTLPFRGTFVSEVSIRDVQELYEVRAALEEVAIRRVMTGLEDADLAILRSALSQTRALLREGHLEESFEAIREFHEALVGLSGNHWLIEMYAGLADHLARVRNICGHIPGRVEKSSEEHARILRALESGDQGEAVTALRDHLDSLARDYSGAAAGVLSLERPAQEPRKVKVNSRNDARA